MTPEERLAAATDAFSNLNLPAGEQNYVCLQALLAIGQLLVEINNRQAAQAAQQAGS